jgi:hypothetical protein
MLFQAPLMTRHSYRKRYELNQTRRFVLAEHCFREPFQSYSIPIIERTSQQGPDHVRTILNLGAWTRSGVWGFVA